MTIKNQSALLSNASATGNAFGWPGGEGVITVEGTIGGATIALQVLSNNGTWVPLSYGATIIQFTAAGANYFVAPAGQIRASVSGGAPSALFCFVTHVANPA